MDTSVPPTDGAAPIFRLPDELLDVIFTEIDDVSQKFLLELVCQKFRSRLLQPICWLNVNKLQFQTSIGGNFSINGRLFESKVEEALDILLRRITVHHVVTLGGVAASLEMQSKICAILTKRKAKIKLRRLSLKETVCDVGSVWLLTALAACGLDNVRAIEVGDWFDCLPTNFTSSFSAVFWAFVACCPNLELFSLVSLTMEHLAELDLGALERSLSNRLQLHTLRVHVQHYPEGAADTFGNICQTCPALETVTLWEEFAHSVDFAEALPAEARNRIKAFGLCLVSHQHRSEYFSRNVGLLFPHLNELFLDSNDGWPPDFVVASIEHLLEVYLARQPHRLTVHMPARKAGDVLELLARKGGKCDMVLLAEGKYTVHKGQLSIDLDLE